MNSAGLYNKNIVNSVDIFNDIVVINRIFMEWHWDEHSFLWTRDEQ